MNATIDFLRHLCYFYVNVHNYFQSSKPWRVSKDIYWKCLVIFPPTNHFLEEKML